MSAYGFSIYLFALCHNGPHDLPGVDHAVRGDELLVPLPAAEEVVPGDVLVGQVSDHPGEEEGGGEVQGGDLASGEGAQHRQHGLGKKLMLL